MRIMKQFDLAHELRKTDCAQPPTALTIGAEPMRRFLSDRRNRLRKERAALLQMAARIKEEIAAYDQLLAELTI